MRLLATLDAADAAALAQSFRQHPSWTLIDFPGGSSTVMGEVRPRAAQPGIGRRVIFDARLALFRFARSPANA